MRLIDMHCDTLWAMWRNRGKDAVAKSSSEGVIGFQKNSLCVDIEKMKRAGSMAQVFACFIHADERKGENRWLQGYQEALEMLTFGKENFVACADDLAPFLKFDDMGENDGKGKISAVLTVEEGGILDGDLSRLDTLYHEGVRLITLTWNYENCIAYPNSRNPVVMQMGLKPFGVEVVERMNELGMVVDVSHLSDGGFWDVLRHSNKPIVASHSNARSLCNHPRNLSDAMMKALAEKGGVAGVNLYPYFVRESGKISAEDVADQIAYMYRVGGEDFVAIGTDFDGFDEGESDMKDIGQMPYLYDIVKQRGFTESQMEKIWSGNALRVLRAVL